MPNLLLRLAFLRRTAAIAAFVGGFLATALLLSAQQGAVSGSIHGRVISWDTGENVVGAVVSVEGSPGIATTDLNGMFSIPKVEPGTHRISAVREGYRPSSVTGIKVAAGEATKADIPLEGSLDASNEDAVELDEFVIESELLASSDLALLGQRQKAATVSDAISADFINRIGAGDAAEAMGRVTGASVLDGKYVLIRGLGDRYSNTLLNGVGIPSADPDRRAVQMDQFPSSLLESIVTSKSFTPDQPGSFSGGSVNMRTKSFPDRHFFSFGISGEYNPRVTGADTLTIPGGGRDWTGMDDGTRALPEGIPSQIPSQSGARIAARNGDFGPAEELDRVSNLFDNRTYFPGTETGGMGFKTSLAVGDRFELGADRLFGYLFSVSYSAGPGHYTEGIAGRYSLGSSDPNDPGFVEPTLVYSPNLSDLTYEESYKANPEIPTGEPQFGVTKTSQYVDWGLYGQIAFTPSANHEISLRAFCNQSADDSVRRGVGESTRSDAGRLYQIYDLLYTERSIQSVQLAGESLFPSFRDIRLEWRASTSESTQEQPDFRTISYFWDFANQQFAAAAGVGNNRFFRDLTEGSDEYAADIIVPLTLWNRPATVKFGGLFQDGSRAYGEKRYRWSREANSRDIIFNYPNPVGIVDRTANSVTFGNSISELPGNLASYNGVQTVSAGYAMADLAPFEKWRCIAGLRAEKTEMSTTPVTGNTNFRAAKINQTDWLPALNIVYALSPKMNLRAAYGRTLARPLYKELADIRVEDPFNDEFFAGNPDLKLTQIDNFDLRWEWFPRNGEILALSLFYKDFQDPIEVTSNPLIGSIQPQNVDQGRVAGIELEGRTKLDVLSPQLAAFSFGANVSLVQSEVSIPQDQLDAIRQILPDASDTRELLGQSPFIVNVDLAYDNTDSGTAVTVAYNLVGERLDIVTSGALPDVYEQPAGDLDLLVSQRLSRRWKLSLSVKNLLDSTHDKTLVSNGNTYFYERFRRGRSFNLGLSYFFE